MFTGRFLRSLAAPWKHYHSCRAMVVREVVVALFLCAPYAAFAQSSITSLGPTLPASCEPIIQAGQRLLDQKTYTRAIQKFTLAIQVCPESRQAALDLTLAYLKARRFQDAERSAKAVIEGPRSEGGQLMLADSYFMQRKFPQAGRTLQKLLAEDPDNADAHKLIGLTLFFYKRYFMAENQLRDALRLRPDDKEALYSLGRIYYTQNNFPAALRAFRRLIQMDPDNYKAYNNLALCYQAVRQDRKAETMFRKAQELAQKLAPDDDWPYANLAAMLLKEGRPQDALPYLRDAIRVNPKSARNFCLMGEALFCEGQVQQALGKLELSAKLDPANAQPHYLMGQAYEKLHDSGRTRREFKLFQKLSEEKETPNPAAPR